MIMEWKRGLQDLSGQEVDEAAEFFGERVPGWSITDPGTRNELQKLIKKFSLGEVIDAIGSAADSYLVVEKDGKASRESMLKIWSNLAGICRVARASKDDPAVREMYYIRGIFRRRMTEQGSYYDDRLALDELKAARSWGVPMDELRQFAIRARSWTQFRDWIGESIEERRATS